MDTLHAPLFLSAIFAVLLSSGVAVLFLVPYRRMKESLRRRTLELSRTTERLASEEGKRTTVNLELEETEARFKRILELLPVGVLILDNDGRFTFANSIAAELFQTTPTSIVGQHYAPEKVDYKVYQADGSPLHTNGNPFSIVLSSGRSVLNTEYQVEWAHGGTSRLSVNATPLRSSQGKRLGVISSIRDVTDLAETQAELEVHRAFFEQMFLQSSAGTQIIDGDGNRLRANTEWCRLFDLDEAELPHLHYNIFQDPQMVGAGLVPALHRVLDYGISAEWEVLFPSSHASPAARWLRIRAQPIRSAKSVVTHMIVEYEDITEKKQAEERTQKSLREKELLLKEVHHRVKNNMQLMKSMLNLQAGYVTDEHTLSMLTDSASRINAMALIHEKLYQGQEFGSVELNAYLSYVAESLYQTYLKPGLEVHLSTELQPLVVDIDTAIPCGLLANELMSNALKHAFDGRRTGTIELALHEQTQPDEPTPDLSWYELVIADDGRGIPDDDAWSTGDSLGLKLVDSLVKQLRGTLELQTDPASGTRFSIRFPRTKGTLRAPSGVSYQ